MSRRIVLAAVIAIGVHAWLALGLAVLMHFSSPEEMTAAELDLSSVELSLSDREAEAPPLQQLPSLPTPPPPEEMRKPEAVRPPEPAGYAPMLVVPPEAASIDLPEPEAEEKVALDLPPVEVEPEPEEPSEETPVEEERPVKPQTEPPAEQNPESEAPPTAETTPAAPAPAPQQARVEVPPKPKQTIKPKYPEESRQRGEEGDVQVEIDVTDHGGVSAVRIVRSSGYAALDAAAQKAARQAKFTPAKADGKAVPTTARLTLTFRLKR